MVLLPVFPIHVAQIATLPERQTPLLLSASSHVEVRFDVVLPSTWKVPDKLPTGEIRDGERSAIVKDTIAGHSIRLDRVVDVPAGRVQPGDEYKKLLGFAQDTDAMIEREVVLSR